MSFDSWLRSRFRHCLRTKALLSYLACFLAIYGFSFSRPVSSPPDISQITLAFTNACEKVRENYAGSCLPEDMTRNAIEGMLKSLDPHCSFFTPSLYESFLNSSSRLFTCEIGARFVSAGGRIFIREVLPGSPAGRAGLRYGDELLTIAGDSVAGLKVSQVNALMTGRCATTVTMEVARPGFGSAITFQIRREKQASTIVYDIFMIAPGVGYLPLRSGFAEEDVFEVTKAVRHLKEMGAHSILLDLRDNPGGLVNVSRDIAALFLERGLPVVTLRKRSLAGGILETVLTSHATFQETIPLVVLVNRRSASATEILVGALQDHDRAWVVGERTFGKGLVQNVYPLSEGYGLLLTSARYYTPSGRFIQRPYQSGRSYEYKCRCGDIPSDSSTQNRQYFTARKRIVFGGSGITPDVEVAEPVSLPVHRSLKLLAFLFTRQLVAGLIPGFPHYRVPPAVDYNHTLQSREGLVNDELIKQFNAFVRSNPLNETIPDTILDRHIGFIRRQLRSEMVTAAYGPARGEQVLLLEDPMVIRAIAEVPQAQRLVGKREPVAGPSLQGETGK